MDTFTALGPAEAHIVTQVTAAITKSQEEARKLVEALDAIDVDCIEALMLDADKKKSVILLAGPMEGLVKSLGMNQLIPMIASAILKPEDAPTS